MPIGSSVLSVGGIAATGGMGTRVGAAFVEVFADVSGLQRGFGQAEALSKSFAARMQAAGAVTARTGAFMTRNLTLPLIAIGGVSAKMAADFETAMTKVDALAGVSTRRVHEFRGEILQLSGETAQAPADLADALYIVGSAGLRATQVLPVLTQAARGAAAQMGDAQTIGHLLTGVLVAYQDEAPSAAAAMDILTTAIQEGKAEPADLASHLGTVVPVAAEMGVSFDELAGSIAAATNVNIEAARAATGLRYMLIQLQNPSEEAKKQLDSYGLTVQQVQNWVERDLITGLRRLADTFDLTTTKGREAFFTTIGGVRSGQVALALMGESANRTQHIMDATAKAAGDTGDEFQTAFEKMTQTPGFQFQKAWNDLKIAAIEAGTVILPIALNIVEAVAGIATAFADLPEPVQQSIIHFGLFVAAAGPLLSVFGRLVSLGAGVAKMFTTVGTAAAAAATATAATGVAGGASVLGGPLMGAGLALPVRGAASVLPGAAGAAGAAAAGGATSAAAVAGTAAAEIAAIAAAVVVGGALITRTVDDISNSNDDLAESTGLTTEQVEQLRNNVAHSAAIFNIFGSQADKVREGGEIAAGVLRDLRESGMGASEAQWELNRVWEDSIQEVGGLTGSMDTLDQNLRARLGLLTQADAATLLGRRLKEVTDTAKEVPFGDTFVEGFKTTFDPKRVNEFVAALISVKDSGLSVAEVFGDPLRQALDDNIVKWSTLEQWFQRAGVAMPFAEAGEFAQALFRSATMTDEQRTAVANALGPLQKYGIALSEIARQQVRGAISAGQSRAAIKAVNRDIGTEAVDAALDHMDSLNREQAAWVANKIAAGDYLAVLHRITEIERQQRQEARRQRRQEARTGFGREGDPTAAAGATVRQQQAAVSELLATQPQLESWGDTLRGAVTFEPGQFRQVEEMIGRLDDAGVSFSELSAKTKQRLRVAIDSGNARRVIATLFNQLVRLDRKKAEPKVGADTEEADRELSDVDQKLNMLDRKQATPSVIVGGTATTTLQSIISYLNQISGMTATATVRLASQIYRDRQHGGWVPGTGLGDHVPMMLEPGEFVVNRRSARGVASFLETLNDKGSMAFFRPGPGRNTRGAPVLAATGAIRAESGRGGDRNLNVHVYGGKPMGPEDLRRNLESWWRRRSW